MFGFIETGRRLWNDALAHRNIRWERFGLSTTRNFQSSILTKLRKEDPWLADMYAQSAQTILGRLDLAFAVFFKGIAKHPRFKKFRNDGSFTYPQAYHGSVKLDCQSIYLSKIGSVKIVIHRPVPNDGLLKTCTIRKEPCGEWYAILVYETDEPLPPMKEIFESPIGIDVGLRSIITTSDGQNIKPPKFFRKSEKRLRHLQRRLSRKKKGSKNLEKARHLVAIQHTKVSRQRKNFNHVLSYRIVKHHDLVIMEDLRIKNMVKNHALAKSINDAGWYQLRTFIEAKENKCGGLLHLVDPAYGTQDCSRCHKRNKILLSQTWFKCVFCGLECDRDINASDNYLQKGLKELGQDMPEVTPVEILPPLIQPTGRASRVDEAGTICGGAHANH